MIDVDLAAVPAQSVTIQIVDSIYVIDVIDIGNDCMACSIERDGVQIISNVRITAGTPILPYEYQEDGNFLMTTENDAIPYYTEFGVTQFLVYVTAEELAAYRAS